jgi:hypothetical protein
VISDSKLGKCWLAAMGAAVIAVGVLVAVAPALAADKACCFTNPRYSGTCSVMPGKDETCGSILSYLNNPSSVGRSYCGGTTIRGGWSTVDCATAKASVQTSSAGSTSNNQNSKPAQP